MLHPDDGDRPQDVAPGDHRRRLINRHPADLGRLVNLRLPDELGSERQVQILRIVGVADNRLTGHDELDPARTPAGLLLHLARRRRGRVLAIVHVTARQLPDPAIYDEPVPPHHQHPLARIIQDHRHRDPPHPEDILREAHMVRKLDIGQAHADMRGIVHQPLAVDYPLARVSHVRDTTGPDVLAILPDRGDGGCRCEARRGRGWAVGCLGFPGVLRIMLGESSALKKTCIAGDFVAGDELVAEGFHEL